MWCSVSNPEQDYTFISRINSHSSVPQQRKEVELFQSRGWAGMSIFTYPYFVSKFLNQHIYYNYVFSTLNSKI